MTTRPVLFLLALTATACGGGGGSGDAPAPIPPVVADPWADVASVLDASSVDDLALIVGDASGEVYRYEKGSFGVADEHAIASASKWLTGATIVALVEQGVMNLDDQPQDYLAYWTDDPADARSQITLDSYSALRRGSTAAPPITAASATSPIAYKPASKSGTPLESTPSRAQRTTTAPSTCRWPLPWQRSRQARHGGTLSS